MTTVNRPRTMRSAGPVAAPSMPASLSWARALLRPRLELALERLDPTSRAQSAYHFGWTDADGRPVQGNGGKALRPTLALLSAQATGADGRAGLPGAVAVELVHNFSLVHDDLMDGDRERRHRVTVWARWGPASAILTGDALLTLAQQELLDVPGPAGPAAARLLSAATQELIRGQVQDLAFEQRADVTLPECVAMAGGKTGSLLGASAAIGAVLVGAPSTTVACLDRFGRELGLAFQLVDDLLGIWGSPSVTGKPVLADLRARKKSLPVSFVLDQGGAAAERLHSWLSGSGPVAEQQVQATAGVLESAGARRWAREQVQVCLQRAEQALTDAELPSPVHDQLLELARFTGARTC